ncbi:MAG: hypothetical protein VYD90_11080 [Pseudomonadota bacterium]|nr:hypothetical protein [Pseudomonadota bacterium]
MSQKPARDPSRMDIEAAARVQDAMMREAFLLAGEGVSAEALLSGMGAAITDVITRLVGAEAVAPWLERYAQLTREVTSDPN